MVHVKAVIFGAIGVIAETSDLQRQAFNRAFAEQGLDWLWDHATYKRLLSINGGRARLRAYRAELSQETLVPDAMIVTLHARKTDHYADLTARGSLKPRRGVAELITTCQHAGVRVALCTSTAVDNVEAIRTALGETLDFGAFESITTIDKIRAPKPAPDAYRHCLLQMGLSAHDVIAIEDTPVSMASAISAGIGVIATPGAMTADQDFSAAALVVDNLETLSLAQIDAVLAKAKPAVHA